MADKNIQDQFFFLHKKLDEMFDCINEIKDSVVCAEKHTFRFLAFDEDAGVFDDAGYVHTTTVNGTAVSSPSNTAWVTKGDAYADTIAATNAISGVSLSVINDVPIKENGKVEFEISYPAGTPVTIVNTHTGATFSFSTAEDGSCVGTFLDREGNPIESGAPVEQ